MSAAAASRDITLVSHNAHSDTHLIRTEIKPPLLLPLWLTVRVQFHAMDTLHRHNYDLSSALSVLVPAGGPVLCRDEMEEWSASEAAMFEEALEKYGKDFNDIRQDFVSVCVCVCLEVCSRSGVCDIMPVRIRCMSTTCNCQPQLLDLKREYLDLVTLPFTVCKALVPMISLPKMLGKKFTKLVTCPKIPSRASLAT